MNYSCYKNRELEPSQPQANVAVPTDELIRVALDSVHQFAKGR